MCRNPSDYRFLYLKYSTLISAFWSLKEISSVSERTCHISTFLNENGTFKDMEIKKEGLYNHVNWSKSFLWKIAMKQYYFFDEFKTLTSIATFQCNLGLNLAINRNHSTLPPKHREDDRFCLQLYPQWGRHYHPAQQYTLGRSPGSTNVKYSLPCSSDTGREVRAQSSAAAWRGTLKN